MDYKKLIKTAMDYRKRAYSPYSKFCVGAAVLFESGSIYGGCNIENASFGATNCAERTAVFTGIAAGEKKIKAIAIIGSLEEYTYPCGICRQVLSEFGDENMEIILAKSEDDYVIKTLDELFPGAFKKDNIR